MPYWQASVSPFVPSGAQPMWPTYCGDGGIVASTIHVHFCPLDQPVCMSGSHVVFVTSGKTIFLVSSPPPHAAKSPISSAPRASLFILIDPSLPDCPDPQRLDARTLSTAPWVGQVHFRRDAWTAITCALRSLGWRASTMIEVTNGASGR